MSYQQIPKAMKDLPNWCVWRLENRNGKPTKAPYSALGGPAKTNDPTTWASFDRAMRALNSGDYSGIGFVLTGTPFVGVDVDSCFDPATGEISAEAADILQLAQSYAERSQSGKGLHIILKGRLPQGRRRNGPYEMYGDGSPRYFAMTGDLLGGAPDIRASQEAIEAIHRKYIDKAPTAPAPAIRNPDTWINLDDTALLDKARQGKHGAAFSRLWAGDISGYPSQSEADIALCNALAWWTNGDVQRVDTLFRQSGLMREKWDRPQSGSTYGRITVENAVNTRRGGYDPEARIKPGKPSETGKALAGFHPENNKRYGWNDMGNGYLFADWYKDRARYVPERKKWFVFDGRVWQPDTGDLRAMELCKRLADGLMVYALSIEDESKRQSYLDHVRKWQRRVVRETILKEAASVYPISLSQFDANPMLFNCLNGTLDLKAGAFRSHRPGDFLSKLAGVKYDPAAQCPRWEQFIDEVMQGDKDKAAFLQKAMGYALTGDTRHECFFVLYGPTSRNGKGTTMETYMRLMGDYGRTARPDTIAQRPGPGGNGPSEDIARLAGARFVNISEPDKKLTLSAALVKTLTGSDTITARFLNENSFEFRPQFKLFVNTNHLPAVTDVTLFSSGRVKIIPFERHFGEDERDEGLKSELAKANNLSGILNWCLEGLRQIGKTGFDAPEAVLAATDEYRENNDKLGRFLSDVMESDSLAETRTADAYRVYQSWCQVNGFYPENAANFKAALGNVAKVARKRPVEGGGLTTLLLGYRFRPEFTPIETPTPWG